MNQIWIVAAVVAALFLLFRVRVRRRRPQRKAPSQTLRISGFQVNAYLHPRMSAACLFDHGVQFGRGFRRKEGPALPHDERCRCEVVPFTFTSSEVFNGALRNVSRLRSSIPDLVPEDAERLLERLKAVESEPLPAEEGGYVEKGRPDSLPAEVVPAVETFLRERYAYLSAQGSPAENAPDEASREA